MKNNEEEVSKASLLIMGIAFDAIGYLSFTIPSLAKRGWR